MTRIWHQSMTVLEDLPGYTNLLQAHTRRVCAPGTEVVLHGLASGTYPSGVPPIEVAAMPWLHTLGSIQIVENVLQAEREGYDAVAMSCFGDPQLDVARSLVDIPVLSSFEGSLLVASTIAKSFGLLVLDEPAAIRARKRSKAYGFADRVAIVSACEPALTEHDLEKGFYGDTAFVDRIAVQVRRMAAAGADLVIPSEGVLNSVLVHNKISDIDGIPIFDSYGAVVTFAEMLVSLRRKTGLRNIRRNSDPAKSAALLDHFRSVTIAALQAASRNAAAAN